MIDNSLTENIEKDPTRLFDGKIIYPNLLAPGVHKIPLESLESTVLVPFQEKRTRAHLCNRLRVLIQELKAYEVEMILWIDGSLCSKKPHPSDIDIVIFINEDQLNSLSSEKKKELVLFLENRNTIRARYGCDLYFNSMNDTERYHHWRSLFSYNQLSEAKGFIQIRVNPNEHLYS
ncbi:MAG: DUF6932 family protein [Acinetobacter amyesii]|uniref:DUF6932 family protein n=1 Tax=Acinetobacter amyesii TaxID=2942470 RepID=UPI003D03FF18